MKKKSINTFIKKFLATFFVIQICFPGWAHASAEILSESETPAYVEWEIIVKYREGYLSDVKNSDENLNIIMKTSGLEAKEVFDEEGIVLLKKETSFVEEIFEVINGVDSDAKMNEIIEQYKSDPAVEIAQKNFLYKPFAAANDTHYSRQWYLENNGKTITGMNDYYKDLFAWRGSAASDYYEKIGLTDTGITAIADVDIDYEGAKELYDMARARLSEEQKSKKVVVAVIDTGIDTAISDFSGKLWSDPNCLDFMWRNISGGCANGYNVANGTSGWEIFADNSGRKNYHGTSVAGVIAAISNNNSGITGIAPDVEIMPLNVLNKDGMINTLSHIRAVMFAEENGADIINASIGSITPMDITETNIVDEVLYDAYKSFSGIIVTAAGNEAIDLDDDSSIVLPAAFARDLTVNGKTLPALENLITVGSITPMAKLSFFSNHWPNSVQILAPGSEIVVAGNHGNNTEFSGTQYDMISGTSFSAPIVAGSLAFLSAAYPDKELSELKEILINSSEKNDSLSVYAKDGNILNLERVMMNLEAETTQNIMLSGSISANISTWTNSGVTLALATSEEIITPENWTKISAKKFQKNITENSNISLQIATESGKTANVHFSVKNIDKNLPTMRILSPENNVTTKENSVSVTFESSDAESGIASHECQINQSAKFSCQNSHKFSLMDGQNLISVTAIDRAGNKSETARIVINKEKVAGNSASSSADSPKPVNHSSGSSGAGGYVAISASDSVPTLSSAPSISPHSEQEITLSSAPENANNSSEKSANIIENSATKSSEIFAKNSLNIFEYSSTKIDYAPEEIEKILEKEWIRESENASIRRFAVSDKMIFLEKMIALGIVGKDSKNEVIEPKISANLFDEIKKLQENFIKNWKEGKFFILDITK